MTNNIQWHNWRRAKHRPKNLYAVVECDACGFVATKAKKDSPLPEVPRCRPAIRIDIEIKEQMEGMQEQMKFVASQQLTGFTLLGDN